MKHQYLKDGVKYHFHNLWLMIKDRNEVTVDNGLSVHMKPETNMEIQFSHVYKHAHGKSALPELKPMLANPRFFMFNNTFLCGTWPQLKPLPTTTLQNGFQHFWSMPSWLRLFHLTVFGVSQHFSFDHVNNDCDPYQDLRDLFCAKVSVQRFLGNLSSRNFIFLSPFAS